MGKGPRSPQLGQGLHGLLAGRTRERILRLLLDLLLDGGHGGVSEGGRPPQTTSAAATPQGNAATLQPGPAPLPAWPPAEGAS